MPSSAPGPIMRAEPIAALPTSAPCADMISTVNSAHIGNQTMASWTQTQVRDTNAISSRVGRGSDALRVDGQHCFVPALSAVTRPILLHAEVIGADVVIARSGQSRFAVGIGELPIDTHLCALPLRGCFAIALAVDVDS